MSFSIGTAVSAPLYGWSFDRLGSYDAALFVAAILFTAGALLLLFIGPYPADRAREQA
jgi:predicted MFS family arabinose efflux permease